VALAAADLPALAASPAVDTAAMARTFTVFCDTLVPADALTPAASAFGIADAIRADITGDRLAERLLAAGCSWLMTDELVAARRFDEIRLRAQEAVARRGAPT